MRYRNGQLITKWKFWIVWAGLAPTGNRCPGGEAALADCFSSDKTKNLDEATSALDESTSEKVIKMIDELREVCGVAMITHDQRQLRICDEVLEFKDGSIMNRYNNEDIRILWSF